MDLKPVLRKSLYLAQVVHANRLLHGANSLCASFYTLFFSLLPNTQPKGPFDNLETETIAELFRCHE